MGITLPETQSGIPLRLDPPCTESNRSSIDWSLLDSLESNLLEPEAEMDLGDKPALDFLLDQDVGSVTLRDSSWPPVCNLAPYKRMPNFGGSETGLSQPLLSILEERMDIEEVNAGRTDSPPSTDPSSRQEATLPLEVLSTSATGPGSNPVELQLAAGEEQGKQLGDQPASGDKEDSPILALPRALVARQYWVSGATNLKIDQPCAEPGNHICHQCRKKFFSARRLQVHAPQHYINVFCPCGEFSYQRDYVRKHQRMSRSQSQAAVCLLTILMQLL